MVSTGEQERAPRGLLGIKSLSTFPAPLREAGTFPLAQLLAESQSMDGTSWMLEIINFSNHYFIKAYWNLRHFVPISLVARSSPLRKRT